MKKKSVLAAALCLVLCFTGCSGGQRPGITSETQSAESSRQETGGEDSMQPANGAGEPFTVDTTIEEVVNEPVFGD